MIGTKQDLIKSLLLGESCCMHAQKIQIAIEKDVSFEMHDCISVPNIEYRHAYVCRKTGNYCLHCLVKHI